MSHPTDFLRDELAIETPENVAFDYDVAGIGNRFIGALVDTLLLGVILVGLYLALLLAVSALQRAFGFDLDDVMNAGGWLRSLLIAGFAVLQFVVFWGYYILFELLWNGQTPGKRVAGTRVVRVDGNPVGLVEVAVRNLVRIVDFLPSFYGLGLIVMFFNRQARRLGDFAAGTLVIRERKAVSLDSLKPSTSIRPSAVGATERIQSLVNSYPAVRNLSAADLDLIQDALTRYRQGKLDPDLVNRLAQAIARKIGLASLPPHAARPFLEEVLAAHTSMTKQVTRE